MKIGIIGGGIAGLATAWLIEGEADVVLFEAREKLGGHADTVLVDVGGVTVPVDAGFEFFSDSMFPYFNRLLTVLKVATAEYPMTYSFFTGRDSALVIPPFQAGSISWKTIFSSQIFDLLDFKLLIDAAAHIIAQADTSTTIEQFIEGMPLASEVKNGFLYPLLASGWAAPLEDFKGFAAYDVLMWCVKNKPAGITPACWKEVCGGTQAYITVLEQQLTRATIKRSSRIAHIAYDNHAYAITQEDGGVSHCDQVVIATNAYQARILLESIPHTVNVRVILDTIDYFRTVIALHGDTRLMPADPAAWSVINVRHNGRDSGITVYKPTNTPTPVFKSWVTYADHLPQPLYDLRTYYHPKVTPSYFQAQRALEPLQGSNGLWLAGIYVSGVDSHDSALLSAIRIAQHIAPNAKRLKLLN